MNELNSTLDDTNPVPPVSYGLFWFRYMGIGIFIFLAGLFQFHLLARWTAFFSLSAAALWCMHFLIGTAWTHAIHRWFTFYRACRHPYLMSLFRTYAAYGIGLPLEALFIHMLDGLAIHHLYSCALTMILTSIFNFFVISRYAIFKRKPLK
jgi:hypothetical protein